MKDEKLILLERAQQIAGRKDLANVDMVDATTVVEFMLMPEKYAIEEKYITEVFFLKEITAIPGTPAFVMGVINLRGKILSVVNLKSFFNLKDRGLSDLNKVIVIQNDNMKFGIVTDSIVGSKTISISSLSPPPLTLHNNGAEFISGVTSDGTILLNAIQLLTSKQIIVNK
jgi:purine-binding chemotaxis protein CheW